MTVYNWNGVGNQTVNFDLGTDVLNMTGVDPFDIQTIRNAGGGTNTIFQTPIGTFTMNGVIYQQLTSCGRLRCQRRVSRRKSPAMTISMGRWCWAIPETMTFTVTPQQLPAGQPRRRQHFRRRWLRHHPWRPRRRHIHNFDQGSVIYGDRGADHIDANNGALDGIGATIYGGNGNPSDPLDGGDTSMEAAATILFKATEVTMDRRQ